jgi:sporulation protein YlmC with PRC-barrel domain
MAQFGMLRDYRFTDAAEDIRGSKLYGSNDEKLGKIDDVIFDHASGDIRYIVVDTGGWLSTKKFVIPAGRIRTSAEHNGDFVVDLNKQQIENFPPYKEADLESDELWADYEGRYRSKWEANPIMHRAGTDLNITPTTRQMEGNRSSERAAARADIVGAGSNRTAATGESEDVEDDGAFETGGYAASTDTVYIDSNAVGIGPRWDTFQDRLRERRKEVIEPQAETDLHRKAS